MKQGWVCLFFWWLLLPALANPGQDLERAWHARDEEALVRLHTPTCWNDEQDSGRRVYDQIRRKPLEFKLLDYRAAGERGVGTFDVYQGGRLADRIWVYFELGRVVAYDENEVHAELFLLNLVDGRIRLEELEGTEELDAVGERFCKEPPAEFQKHFDSRTSYQRSYLLPQTGLALLVYRTTDEEFALKVARVGIDWKPIGVSYLLSESALIPNGSDLPACATNLKRLTEQLEQYAREHAGAYPTSLDDIENFTTCPTSGKPYYYAVTIDLQWWGLSCEGRAHQIPNYPAASRSSGVRLASFGSRYTDCADNLRAIWQLLENYKALNGKYPEIPAYLVDRPEIRLPRCSKDEKIWAPNETDYALMHLPGGLHLFCTSTEHVGEGFAPLQPASINGLPAKAMFLLKDGTSVPPGASP